MEEHTQALDIVCKHFHQEYHSKDIANLRRQKARAHSENHRLRLKLARVEQQLLLERTLVRNYQVLLYRASSRLGAIAKMLAEMFH